MRRFVVFAAAALSLVACGRDRAVLASEISRLRTERDKLAKVAEHLDEFKLERDALAKELAAAEAMGIAMAHEDRIKKAAGTAGITGKRVNPYGPAASMSPWELTGSGAELFATLRSTNGALGVEKATFTPPSWQVNVPAYDPVGPFSSFVPGVTPPPSPQSTPPAGRFETKRMQALRAEIASLEREIQELNRLIQGTDLPAFEQAKADLERHRNVLRTPSRLDRVASLAMPLFLDAKAVCSQGSLVVAQQSVRFFCKPANGDLEATSTTLRATLSALEGWKVGTISIDDAAPEPLQGTLTPHPL